MEMPGMMGAMGLWMLLWSVVGVALLTVLVVVLVRHTRPGETAQQLSATAAEEALYRRYAAGDISGDDYLEQSARLRRDST